MIVRNMSEKEVKFLRYKDGATDRTITIEIGPADIPDRIASLKEQGCTDFEGLDENKALLEKYK